MRTWRLPTLTTEAARNLDAARSRTVMLALVIAALSGAVTWSELAVTERILDFQSGLVDAGGNVLVATHPQGLSIETCLDLQSRNEVVAAGASTAKGVGTTNLAPGVTFETVAVTPGLPAVWGVSGDEVALAQGMMVGSAVADELGLVDGSHLAMTGGPSLPVEVVDVGRRSPQSQRSIMMAMVPSGLADVCWVEMQPGAARAGEALLHTIYAGTGPTLAVRPWIRAGDFANDPVEDLNTRPQQHAWIAVGLVLVFVLWLDLWFRRSALGLYRLLGTTRSGLLVQAQMEVLMVATVASLIGFFWGGAVFGAVDGASPVLDQYLIAARTTGSILAVLLILGPLPVVLIGNTRTLLDQLKDR